MAIFENERIFELLQQFNPWWQSGGMAAALPAVRRSAYQQVMSTLTDTEIRRFAVLSGARRIGKTTVLMQVVEELLRQGVPSTNIFYVSFDNPILKLCGFHQVWETYRRFVPHSGIYYAFLDEIQYAEEWSLWVKSLYDTEPQLRLAATGSAGPAIERGASDSGVALLPLCREHQASAAFVATKSASDFGITRRADGVGVPLVRIPTPSLCYLLNSK